MNRMRFRTASKHWRAYATVGVLALALYLPGFWWGAPYATGPDRVDAWGVDDETPLGPLAELRNIVAPQPDRNLGYPLGYSFLAAAAYSPYLVYLKLTGRLGVVSVTYPYGLDDPVTALRTLSWITHLFTVLMGAAVVVAAYDAARTVWDERTGRLAAAFTLLSYPMFYYARTGNVDVPVLCFIALAVAAFARSVVQGLTPSRAVALGVAVGLALGTKESSLGAFLAMPVVLGWRQWRPVNGAGQAAWRTPLLGVAGAILSFGVASGLFVDPHRYFDHIAFLRGRVQTLAAGETLPALTYPYTWAGHVAFAGKILGYLAALLTWPGLLLAIACVVWTVRRERQAAILALPALTYLLFMFIALRSAQLRYFLPAGFGLAFFAARAVTLAWEAPARWLRRGMSAVVAGVLGLGLLRGIDLTYQMIRDSRFAAGAWLAARVGPGTRVEYFGASQKLPPLPANVVTAKATEYFGMYRQPRTDLVKVQEILQGWKARSPAFIIVMPDHTSRPGDPFDNTCPPALYAGLLGGTMGYRVAAFFQTPPLFPWLGRPTLDYPTVNPPIRVFMPEGPAREPGSTPA